MEITFNWLAQWGKDLLLNRNIYGKPGPFAQLALYPNLTSLSLDQGFGDGQTQAGFSVEQPAGFVSPKRTLENEG